MNTLATFLFVLYGLGILYFIWSFFFKENEKDQTKIQEADKEILSKKEYDILDSKFKQNLLFLILVLLIVFWPIVTIIGIIDDLLPNSTRS